MQNDRDKIEWVELGNVRFVEWANSQVCEIWNVPYIGKRIETAMIERFIV